MMTKIIAHNDPPQYIYYCDCLLLLLYCWKAIFLSQLHVNMFIY